MRLFLYAGAVALSFAYCACTLAQGIEFAPLTGYASLAVSDDGNIFKASGYTSSPEAQKIAENHCLEYGVSACRTATAKVEAFFVGVVCDGHGFAAASMISYDEAEKGALKQAASYLGGAYTYCRAVGRFHPAG